ncbi:MAG: FAD-dependent oxidoreductase [Gammaproteobacteria bacterium]|nr:FAD-dependent oxidoreductase [Gammaproteobacteria bacterium]
MNNFYQHIGRIGGLVGLTVAPCTLFYNRYNMKTEKNLRGQPKIAIVGAGLTGLKAAQVIKEKSKGQFHVTMFEAMPETGGRVKTDYSKNSTLYSEHGALLFANTDKHVIDLADELNLELQPRIDPFHQRYFINGNWTDKRKFNEIFAKYIINEIITLQITEASDWLTHPQLDNLTLEEFLRIKTANLPQQESDEIIQAIMSNFVGLCSGNIKTYPALEALRDFSQYLKTTGFFSIKGGNRLLASNLTEKVKQQGVIINCEHPVTNIIQKEGKVIVGFYNKTGYHEQKFDRVIIAVPPSMLNSNYSEAIEFEPPLPQQELFDNLPYNKTITRVYFETQDRPWLKESPTAATIIGGVDGTLWIEDHTSHLPDNQGAIIEVHASGNIGLAIQNADNPIKMAQDIITEVYPSLKGKLSSAKIVLWDSPYYQGAYAHCGLGQVSQLNKMAESFKEVDLAGPYLDMMSPCSMNGALNSGINAANNTINELNKKLSLNSDADNEGYDSSTHSTTSDEQQTLTPS